MTKRFTVLANKVSKETDMQMCMNKTYSHHASRSGDVTVEKVNTKLDHATVSKQHHVKLDKNINKNDYLNMAN